MKLASLKGGRDGRLVVVSNDLNRFLSAGTAYPTLQSALDDWSSARPLLAQIAERVNAGEGEAFNQALLRIWLGPEPPTEGLREGMLGG